MALSRKQRRRWSYRVATSRRWSHWDHEQAADGVVPRGELFSYEAENTLIRGPSPRGTFGSVPFSEEVGQGAHYAIGSHGCRGPDCPDIEARSGRLLEIANRVTYQATQKGRTID